MRAAPLFFCALMVLEVRVSALRSYLYFPSSDVWWTNETLFPESNATMAALSAQCDATPSCIGFNTHGWLKRGAASLAPATVDLYLVAPDPPPPPPTFLWPQPRAVALGAGARPVASLGFSLSQAGGGAPIPELAAAFARLPAALFRHGLHPPLPGAIGGLVVTVESGGAVPLDVGVSERYALALSGDGATIALTADTVWGALQGMQTLVQLLDFDFDAGAYTLPSTVDISDWPQVPYRGIMVDPARQFLPPSVLRQVIDSLTMVKMNVLHVHILDCDSFPIQVAAPFSNLWAGSFSPRERYTATELAALSEYGRVRGVNVIYEFDQPGHVSPTAGGFA